jgi:hypothetical protein
MRSNDHIPARMRCELAVYCPHCLAEPGEPCYEETGTSYVKPHDSRRTEQERLVQQAEELYEAQGGEE